MEKLRIILEKGKERIVNLNGERICDQVSNLCGCCNGDYSLISLEEKEQIIKFLSMGMNIKIKEKILNNSLNKKSCYFHDKDLKKCLIFNLRPICCRYISYKIYEKEDCFKTCSPLAPCKKGCSTVMRIEKRDVGIEEYPLRSYEVNEKKYYYIDDKLIPEYQDYKKRQNIKLSNIIDEIKK